MEYSGQEGLFRQAGTAGWCGSFGSKQYFQGGITVFCVNFSFLNSPENKEAALCDGAVDHIAFDVVDIEEAYKFITGLQIKILTEITFLPFWEKGVKFFIAQGPNLERLEFAQHIK